MANVQRDLTSHLTPLSVEFNALLNAAYQTPPDASSGLQQLWTQPPSEQVVLSRVAKIVPRASAEEKAKISASVYAHWHSPVDHVHPFQQISDELHFYVATESVGGRSLFAKQPIVKSQPILTEKPFLVLPDESFDVGARIALLLPKAALFQMLHLHGHPGRMQHWSGRGHHSPLAKLADHLAGILAANMFGFENGLTLLFLRGSLFNHSADSNVDVIPIEGEDGSLQAIEFYATKPIAIHTELLYCYDKVSAWRDQQTVSNHLYHQYGIPRTA